MPKLDISHQTFALKQPFTISRGTRTEIHVVTVEIEFEGVKGRGECIPYKHYGETIESVVESLEAVRKAIEDGLTRQELQNYMSAGAARNALDCAYWDLEAKHEGVSVFDLVHIRSPHAMKTAYTISVGTTEDMLVAAKSASHFPLLKVKLAGDGDSERMKAVREGAPESDIIVDANEAWQKEHIKYYLRTAESIGVKLIEQPLPSNSDDFLRRVETSIPICADESIHTLRDLSKVSELYDAINIKLDKTGGLTEALHLQKAARQKGLIVMIGCMLGTSLSMAPATVLAQNADFVDLDGPLLLAEDRDHAIQYDGSIMQLPSSKLWG
jgi:L-alanine-DL-glutamate epimerase-like enolase superfamily enzyme